VVTAAIDRKDLLDRRIALGGTFNLREVRDYQAPGGRSIQPRLLYRADALHRLDDDGRLALRERGIRTVIDLREPPERDREPDQLEGVGATVVIYPLLNLGEGRTPGGAVAGGGVQLDSLYAWIVSERGRALAGVIHELARPGALPAVVHCTAGKDRTGIVVALLLSALGVDDQTVAADFAVTELNLGGEFRRSFLERAAAQGLDPVVVASALGSDPSLAHQILAQVAASDGSAAAYLVRHGLPEADLAALREALLTPPVTKEEGDAA
jgi:protein-tyrosine phosphatase